MIANRVTTDPKRKKNPRTSRTIRPGTVDVQQPTNLLEVHPFEAVASPRARISAASDKLESNLNPQRLSPSHC